MRIHALSTGAVRLKDAFLHARTGPLRQVRLFTKGPFSGPMPIHCFVIEHEDTRILVDTGETSMVGDIPFAQFDVSEADELPARLATIGLTTGDIDRVVVTHLHGDHIDGAVHVACEIEVHDEELRHANGAMSRVFQKVLRQPLPDGITYAPFRLLDDPFGAFARSRNLTEDGRVIAVATPGHTPGHVSVIAIDDDGNHVLIAGDATDSLEQLLARRPDAIGPKPKVSVATIDAILEHGRRHPTVFLPAHDPQTAERLAARTTL